MLGAAHLYGSFSQGECGNNRKIPLFLKARFDWLFDEGGSQSKDMRAAIRLLPLLLNDRNGTGNLSASERGQPKVSSTL